MRKTFIFISLLVGFTRISLSQTTYLTDIKTNEDFRDKNGLITIPINYWRFDSCLNIKKLCKYNTSTAANIKIYQNGDTSRFVFLRSNNSGYKSKHMNDSFTYYFFPQSINSSFLIRKIWIDKGSSIKDDYYIFKTDTFNLEVVDTLILSNPQLIKKIFGKAETNDQKELRIFVLKSPTLKESTVLHFWAEKIGVVKLTDEKCWRYSFEMKDNRTKAIEKLFEKIMTIIKFNYKDPSWLSEPCYFL